MIQLTAYGCESCSRVVRLKSSMVRHEKNCTARPENRACKTCKWLDKHPEEYWQCTCPNEEVDGEVPKRHCIGWETVRE